MKENIKIEIEIPKMKGAELLNANVDLDKGLIIAEYGEPKLLVPENIKIYRQKSSIKDELWGDLMISFNNGKQLLAYAEGTYVVENYKLIGDFLEPVQCELTPCKREDLNEGDTAFSIYKACPEIEDLNLVRNYCKILIKDELVAFVAQNKDIKVGSWDNPDLQWFKVKPIK